jgi:hypothetical protein
MLDRSPFRQQREGEGEAAEPRKSRLAALARANHRARLQLERLDVRPQRFLVQPVLDTVGKSGEMSRRWMAGCRRGACALVRLERKKRCRGSIECDTPEAGTGVDAMLYR